MNNLHELADACLSYGTPASQDAAERAFREAMDASGQIVLVEWIAQYRMPGGLFVRSLAMAALAWSTVQCPATPIHRLTP